MDMNCSHWVKHWWALYWWYYFTSNTNYFTLTVTPTLISQRAKKKKKRSLNFLYYSTYPVTLRIQILSQTKTRYSVCLHIFFPFQKHPLSNVGHTFDCLNFHEWVENLLLAEWRHNFPDCSAHLHHITAKVKLKLKPRDHCWMILGLLFKRLS